MKKIVLGLLFIALTACSTPPAPETQEKSSEVPVEVPVKETITETEETTFVEKKEEKEEHPPSEFKKNIPVGTPGVNHIDGVIDPTSIEAHVLSEVNLQSVVNKFNALPDGYEPPDLTAIESNFYGWGTLYLRKEAAEAWNQLEAKAKEEGLTLMVFSAYRSQDTQKGLFDSAYAVNPLDAVLYTALPRRSEHEMGLAVDVSYDSGFPVDFYSRPEGKFMQQHAADYGFILRYPEGKEAITGYGYESWHFRYVGKELAKLLKEKDITLEEYYGLDVKATETSESSSAEKKEVSGSDKTPSQGRLRVLETLNVRIKPSIDSEQIGSLEAGIEVNFSQKSQGWYQIEFNGQAAWIHGDYVEVLP